MMERIAHYPRRDGPLPDGARWVGRPSRWGNPYKVKDARSAGYEGSDAQLQAMCVAMFGAWLRGDDPLSRGFAPARRRRLLDGLPELADATALACACPLGSPCHADVLIDHLARPTEDET